MKGIKNENDGKKAYTAFGETGYSQMQMVTAHCPTVQRDPASAPVVREFRRGWKRALTWIT